MVKCCIFFLCVCVVGNNPNTIFYLKMSLFPCRKGHYFQIQKLQLTTLFFLYFKNLEAFPSGLKVSDMKSAVLWTGVSLPIVLVISCCFQDFSFVFSSRSLIMMHLGLGYFGFTLFSIHWASWICRFVFWQIWEGFSHYFIEYFFSSTLSTFSFWPKIQMWSLLLLFYLFTSVYWFFSGYFSQILRLHKFCWSVLKLINFILLSSLKPISEFYLFTCFCDLFFSYICFIWFLFYNFLLLCWDFLFFD